MKVITHRPVTLKRGCDHCGQRAAVITECQLPYGPPAKKGYGVSQWFDLCQSCLQRAAAFPIDFVTLETLFGPGGPRLEVERAQPRVLPMHYVERPHSGMASLCGVRRPQIVSSQPAEVTCKRCLQRLEPIPT